MTGPTHQAQVTGHLLLITGLTHWSSGTDVQSGHWSVLPVTGQYYTGHRTPVNMHRSLTSQQLLVTGQRSGTDVLLLLRIIPLLRRRIHICRRLVPIIEVDVRHALIHQAVLIPVIVMINIDHLDHHGNDTRGYVIRSRSSSRRRSRSRSRHHRNNGHRQASLKHCHSNFYDRSHYYPISDCNVSLPHAPVPSVMSTHVALTDPILQPFKSGVHLTTTAVLSAPRVSTTIPLENPGCYSVFA
ncbi:hypothetical protein DPMN_157303 [Dreissena polymorpha]|uniref:Uncharacterized protein n=1 Tax=Dreissena polymorpha TaxID=45954 RepID=A0A9D4EH34_DREPO|nr:hypothetical protein DPMN_157303 [Dreissena polymorpha]